MPLSSAGTLFDTYRCSLIMAAVDEHYFSTRSSSYLRAARAARQWACIQKILIISSGYSNTKLGFQFYPLYVRTYNNWELLFVHNLFSTNLYDYVRCHLYSYSCALGLWQQQHLHNYL